MGNITDLLELIEEPLEDLSGDLEEVLRKIVDRNNDNKRLTKHAQIRIKNQHEKFYHEMNTYRQDNNNLFSKIISNICSAYEQFEDFYTEFGPNTSEEVKKASKEILDRYISLETEAITTREEAMKLFFHEYKE